MHSAEKPGGAPLEHILVAGGGLAGHMVTAALAQQLAPQVRITLIDTADTAGSDLFYGTVTAPTAYPFNLATGLSEPALVLDSDTAFSWGTEYIDWSADGGRWVQCFNQPFPIFDGVLFHHYLAKVGIGQLDPFLVASAAARRGVFAHPPRESGGAGQQVLANAEYGYAIDPDSYARLFAATVATRRLDTIVGTIAAVETGAAGISAIRLTNGQTISADLYVDCTGPEATLLSHLAQDFVGERRIGIASGDEPAPRLGPPLRTVSAGSHGWRAQTPLRGRTLHTAVYDPRLDDAARHALGREPERAATAILGRQRQAWVRNCVAIGHASRVVEPLTPAPLMLLERDVERLMGLIPPTGGMAVERREYNRRHGEDYEHAEFFNRALIETNALPDTPFWRDARATTLPDKLARKLTMFEERGVLVAYDLEPFNAEDWTILHFGMGRRTARHDRMADRAVATQVQKFLTGMQRDIEQVVATLPSHADYMAQLEQYLIRNRR